MGRLLLLAVAACVLPACASGDEQSARFSERGVTLATPHSWSVSGFSETVFPSRLVAASYDVDRGDVEGDCGGQAAIERLPLTGAYVLLIDYGLGLEASAFTDRLPVSIRDGQLAEFECFGRSYAFHFLVDGRGIQGHIGFGPDADAEIRAGALGVLNSIEAE